MSTTSKSLARRVAARHLGQDAPARGKTAGEVRFIKDRGGDHAEWAWNPPGASERNIDPSYEYNPKNLEPLSRVLRSALMALGHIQTARSTFTKVKSRQVSPDGSLGGQGYVMPVKDIRKQLSNCDEALSAISDTLYDEINAPHWNPQVDGHGGDPREREEVKQVLDDVEEIREDPEEWAEDEEEKMDKTASVSRVAVAADERRRSRHIKEALRILTRRYDAVLVDNNRILVHPTIDEWENAEGGLDANYTVPTWEEVRKAMGSAADAWLIQQVSDADVDRLKGKVRTLQNRKQRSEPYGVLLTLKFEAWNGSAR